MIILVNFRSVVSCCAHSITHALMTPWQTEISEDYDIKLSRFFYDESKSVL